MNSPQHQLDTKTLELIVMRCGRKLEVREYGDPRGHPAFFFHGLIGSHHQASYIALEAQRAGLRIIAPNRPGVGMSEYVVRTSPCETVPDVEDVAEALGLDEFSVIGISGGTPHALAVLDRLRDRVRTATIISGMGPMWLRGALDGMERRRRAPRARRPVSSPRPAGVPEGRGPVPAKPDGSPGWSDADLGCRRPTTIRA